MTDLPNDIPHETLTPKQVHTLDRNLADAREAFLQLVTFYRQASAGDAPEHRAVGQLLAMIKGAGHSRDDLALVLVGAVRFVLSSAEGMAAAVEAATRLDPDLLDALAFRWETQAEIAQKEAQTYAAMDKQALAGTQAARASENLRCAGELRAVLSGDVQAALGGA